MFANAGTRSAFYIFLFLLFFPVCAHALPDVTVGPFGPGTLDGTEPFNTFGACANDSAQDIDGEDCGESNGVVRTQDVVSHIWSVTADNYTPGQDNLMNVVLEQTITPSANAEVLFEGIPVPCTPIGGGGNTPPSAIVDNGDGSSTLICNLGEFSEGAQQSVAVNVKISGNSWNGTDYTSTQRVYSLGDDGNPNANEGTSAPVGPIKISAAPAFDLVSSLSSTQSMRTGYIATRDVGNGPELGFYAYRNLRLVAARKTGIEAIEQPLVFKDEISAKANSETGPDYALEFYVTECRDNPSGWSGEIYGSKTYNPTYDGGSFKYHAADSGTCTYTRDNPADPTSTSFTVNISDADLSGTHYPTKAFGGADLTPGPYYVMNQRVQVWVPFRSIDMADGVLDDQGYVYLTSVFSDFDPDSVSGLSNYGAETEPGYNGADMDGERGNNVIGAALELVVKGSFSKHNHRTVRDNGTTRTPLNEGEYILSHSGTGELEPGETHASTVYFGNNGTKSLANPMACDVFDNTTLQLTDRGNTGATAGTYAYVGTDDDDGFDYTNYVVEYAHFDLSGDDPLDADGDGNRDYELSTGRYLGNWARQRTLRCDDGVPADGWFVDPNAVPGGIDNVNAARLRLTDAAVAAGVEFDPGQYIRFVIPLMARDSFNGGPYNGEKIPVGTVMPNFAGVKSDNWSSGWTAREYTASPENGDRDGDRVTLTRIKIVLDKESVYPVAGPGESASILAGDKIVWKVNTAVQSVLPNPSDAENLRIIDVLPPEATYDAACTAEQTDATPPNLVEYNTDKDGNAAPGYTRLSWNFGDVTANTIIPPRIFCTITDSLALHGTDVVNYAEIRADNVITPLDTRSATHTIKLEQTGSIQTAKKVDMPLDDMNDDQVYTISWANFAASFTIDPPTIIDVLPFTSGSGDGMGSLSERTPASDFNGKLELTGAPTVTWLDDSVPGGGDPHADIGTWYYSADAPQTINYDPDVNAAEGTTTWCLEADFNTGACPADFAAVTALKFVSNYALEKDGDPRQGMKAEFTLQAGDPGDPNGPDANLPGDIYTNRFTFDSTSLPADQFLRSNNVSVEIAAFSIGDLIFADVNGNGKYDAGTDGVVPDGVKVELYQVAGDGSESKVRETTTGGVGPGRYLFEPLASGKYYVKIPASEFQPGGLLENWGEAPPTGTDREDDDDNEHIDQHGYSETTPQALGIRTGTVELTANPPPPGGVPTGNEPTGDNVLPITDPTGDDFSNLTLDIGLDSPLSSLGNVVWIDQNNNGLQDPDETGLSNVTVNLLAADGNVLQTTRTDYNGYYSFTGLVAADYIVEVVKPAGYEFGPQDAVADDTADSDVDTTTGRTDPITLAFGQHDTQWDAGLYPLGSIGDRVWIDTNANGLQDIAETGGISGVSITLQDSGGAVITTTTTDGDGKYLFSDLPPGNYTVDVDTTNPALAGYNLTTANDPYAVVLAAGQDYRAADFGYVNYASVGDKVWHDLNGDGIQGGGEPGVAGVAVRLLDSGSGTIAKSTTTDADGEYLFADVIPGDYVVEFVLPTDYTGFVANDLGGDDALDSDAVGSGGKTGTFTLAAGENRTDIDAGLYQSATLGNLLWLDEDGDGAQGTEEPGLVGTQVTLTGTLGDGSTFTPVSVVTDENGQYQFSDLYPGDYTVTFADSGFVPADQGGDDTLDSDVAPNGAAMVTLASGDNNQTIDAGIAAAAVTGRVWIDNNTQDAIDNGTANEDGAVGVTANLIDAATGEVVATTTTGADGVYTFSGVKPGNYLVEIVEPANMGFVTQDQGGDDTTDSDVNTATGRSEPFALAAGQMVTDIDAGIEPGSLGDHVTLDMNNNGIQDAGEPGVAGIKVTLLDGGGAVIDTQVTDATGFYNFAGVAPGNYTVHFDIPADMDFAAADVGSNDTVDFDTNAAGDVSVTVVSGEGNQTIDAGIVPAIIGDTVWFDRDANGAQDAGEPGIADIVVTLLDENKAPVLDAGGNPVTTTTDADGYYSFSVLPGTYGVQFTLPNGMDFTVQNGTSDDELDSDADENGQTQAVKVASGDKDLSLDAGVMPAMVAGTVLSDANGNGTEEVGDTGIAGVTITLTGTDVLGNPVELTTETDSDGQYQFMVMPGTYTLTETNPAGLTSSGAEAGTVGSTVVNDDKLEVTLKSGDKSAENDFLDYKPASLSGQVREDRNADGDTTDNADTGIGGVEIILWLDSNGDGTPDSVFANTTTNPNGEYSFLDIPPGSYVVIESDLAAYTSTADTEGGNDNRIVVKLASGETSPNHDFLDTRAANISGQVRNDTDRDGDTNDTEPGIAGLTISLYTDPNGDGDPADGALVTTTTTNVQGEYQFNNVLPGDYVVVETDGTDTESTADTSGDNDNRIPLTLVANTDSTDNDFLDTSVLGSLSGVVWNDDNSNGLLDGGEAGIPGVTVVVKGLAGNVIATLSTDADGNYALGDLSAGNYQLEVDPATLPAGVIQTGDPDGSKDHQTVATVTAGNNTDKLDFGYVGPGSISDRVWHDNNMNGIQDAGEAGIADVAVRLLDNTGAVVATTLTDSNGLYQFMGLLEGDYVVEFIRPLDYEAFSPAAVGGDSALDSDAASNGKTAVIALAASEDRNDIDAGLYQLASLGDVVWFDSNGNGVQDSGEARLSGIEVVLSGTDGSGNAIAPQTVLTDEDGRYLFENLAPGDYGLQFKLPAGMSFTGADLGGDDTLDSDVSAGGNTSVTLASGEHNHDVDAGVLPAGLTGRVWFDNAGNNALDDGVGIEEGVVGVNVNLIDTATGNVVMNTTTGADGVYLFTGILPGEYIVEVVEPANMGFVTQDQGVDDAIDSDVDPQNGRSVTFTVQSGDSITDIDAGIEPGKLGDRIWLDENNNGLQDAGEPGVPLIKVNLLDSGGSLLQSTATDATGFYNFAGVSPGEYEVEFALPPAMALTEQDRGVDDTLDSDADVVTKKAGVTVVSGVSNQTVDAGIIPATLGDTVWFDANGNGLQDDGETPLAGVTVHLIDALGNAVTDVAGNPLMTLTDDTGNYQFIVIPGDYGIQVELPDGVAFTTQNAGAEALDSDVDPASGKSEAVALASGDNHVDLDAGIQPAMISGTLLIDNNANGNQDADDNQTSPGVTITISGTDVFGNPVTVTTTTDDQGDYSVNVPPGTYSVQESTPAGLTSTGSVSGTTGATVVDVDTLMVMVASGESSDDNNFLNSEPARLSGQVRDDLNGDGDLSEGADQPLSGVEIFLWLDRDNDGNADEVVANTVTDTSGRYEFSDLQPGHYIVTESDLSAYVSTADTAGDNDNRIAVTLASGEQSPGHDFLDTQTGIISGQVRNDTDRDGDLTEAEAGLPGVTVSLYTDPNGDGDPADGVLVKTDGTDAQGNYQFTGIVPGNYVLVESDPEEYESTADTAGANDNRIAVAHVSGQSSTHNDFLDTSMLGSLSGVIWSDTDSDGNREFGEGGLAAVDVVVKDLLGNIITTVMTDANGAYRVDDLLAGNYDIEVVASTLPMGAIQTGDPDDALDHETITTVISGQHTSELDFGYVAPASIGDRVWHDINLNGIQDTDEPGIPGVAVSLLDSDDKPIETTITDAQGNYLFGGLLQGDFKLVFVKPEGYQGFSNPAQGSSDADSDVVDSSSGETAVFTLAAGEQKRDVDAGLYKTASLGDTLWFDTNSNGIQDTDEPGVADVPVTLNGRPANGELFVPREITTDENGRYLFSDLIPGDYTLSFVLPTGMSFTTRDQGVDDAVDSDVSPAGAAEITLVSAEQNRDLDAGILPAAISGRVWIDNAAVADIDDGVGVEDGVIGVNINLIDVSTGNAILTTTTGEDGIYVFEGVPAGDYLIEVVEPANMGFVNQDQGADDAVDSDVNPQTGRSEPFTIQSGDSITDIDAGIEPGQLGDHVWLDENNNGLQDAGEPGVPDVTVNLLNQNGETVASRITDETGFYHFSGVLPAEYEVQFVLVDDMSLTEQDYGTDDSLDSDADVATGKTAVTVISGVGNQTVDAGVIPATLGDTVWFDANGNGLQDDGEMPLAGVTVHLIDALGNAVTDAAGNPLMTLTDANGHYQFTVIPGGYGIQVELPDGAAFTTQNAGAEALDSDVDPASGKSEAVAVASGDNHVDLDAGIQPAMISGTVLIDNNANGNQDADDNRTSPGVTITISGTDVFGNPFTVTTTTDDQGDYSANVPPGTYSVQQTTPAGLTSTGSVPGTTGATVVDVDTLMVMVASGESSDDNNFLNSEPARLSGQVRDDLNGDGDLSEGSDQPLSGVEIFLRLDRDNDGNADEVVANTVTDTAGNYAFSDLQPGHYIVSESDLSAYVSTADTSGDNDNRIAVTLASGEQSPGHDFLDTQTGIISGQVRNDTDRDGELAEADAGLPGVTVSLYTDPNGDGDPAGGVLVKTDGTDAQGNYQFTGIVPGNYVVVENDPEAYESTADTAGANDNRIAVAHVSGQSSTHNDFLDTSILGSLSGTVWHDSNADGVLASADESGLAGVKVRVQNESGVIIATLTTNTNGYYTAQDLPTGVYTVMVDPATLPAQMLQTADPDAELNHATQAQVVAGVNTPDLNFGYVGSASVGDTVWEDLNGNGLQDTGEPGVNNIAVILSQNGAEVAATATDSAGKYRFDGLMPADYEISFALPADYYLTAANQGADDALDSDPAADGKVNITLTSGVDLSVDAGVYRYGALGDTVWLDMNSNGVQDADEPAISEMTVNLLDASGEPQRDEAGQPISTQTDANGRYLFSGLQPGDYLVEFVAPEGISFTAADQGLDDAKDSDAQANGQAPATVISAQTNRSVDVGIVPAAVSGRVWIDNDTSNNLDDGVGVESGVVGVAVVLLAADTGAVVATTTTGPDGIYHFTGIEPGDYRVQVTQPANMTFVSPHQGTDDAIDSDVDNNNGRSAVFSLTSGASVTDLDAGIEPGGLGDHVFLDENQNGLQDSGEPGVAGVIVKLIDSGGLVVERQTTDATGFYNFAAELPGEYSVEFTLPEGMRFTSQNTGSDDTLDSDADKDGRTTVTVISGVGNQTVDAGVVPALIGDTVWLDSDGDGTQGGSEPVLANVMVTLLDDKGEPVLDQGSNIVTTQTDATGYYQFIVEPGSYALQFTRPDGAEFTLQDQGGNDEADSDADIISGKTVSVTVNSGDQNRSLDAGIQPAVISGAVLQDNNGDGAGDAADTPLENVTVTLEGTDVFGNPVTQTVTTDKDGHYTFDVPPGTYTVTATNPDGFVSSGTETGVDEEVINSDTLEITVLSGETAANNRFLDYQPASISGQVREDTNGDGDITDSSDPVLSGVSIMLWRDTDGDGEPDEVVAHTTTDDKGDYYFTDLAPGHYIVVETDEPGYQSSADTDGDNDNRIAIPLASGEDSSGHDFLDTRPTVISGSVVEDTNRDGERDDSEPGVAGVVITLYTDPNGDGNPEDGVPLSSVETDADGNYVFADVLPGHYVLVETDPENYDSTGDSSGEPTDNLIPLSNVSGENNTGNTFLDTRALGSVSGVIWEDTDADGTQGMTEPLLKGIDVELLDKNGDVIATTTTNPQGEYHFSDQLPGDYTVRIPAIAIPSGYEQTADPDEVLDNRHNLTIAAQTDHTHVDFAYAAVSNLGDRVWHDANANGIQDDGELGIPGVMVRLYSDPNGDGQTNDGKLLSATATNTDGDYLFANLLPDQYVLHFETLDGYFITAQEQGDDRAADSNMDQNGYAAVSLTAAGDSALDAGFWQFGSLGNRVWLDENADGYQDSTEPSVSEVEVSLLDAAGQPVLDDNGQPVTTVTDAQGEYHFDDLPPGDYRVSFTTPDGITFTQTNRGSDDTLDSDADANGVAAATVISAQHNSTVDAGLIPAAISGRVWIDNNPANGIDDGTGNENGLVGVVINLLDEDGKIVSSTTSGMDGSYSFTSVLPGEYQLEFVAPENMQLVAANQGDDESRDSDADPVTGLTAPFTLTSGQGISDLDAGMEPGTLGDRVWLDLNINGVQDADEPGVAGIEIHLLDKAGLTVASTTSDDNGFYSFDQVVPGDYTIRFERPVNADFVVANAGSDDTADSDVDVNGAVAVVVQSGKEGDLSIDAGIVPALIGDRVWLDSNSDGLQSEGEPGLAGITVALLDAEGKTVDTTVTDKDGLYQFAMLPGEWQVQVQAPDSRYTVSAVGIDRSIDSDVNAQGTSALLATASGDKELQVDAGILPGVIKGRVIEDNNADGAVDDKDGSVAGVTLVISGSDSYGNPVSTTVVTDSNGEYELVLPPGTYTVTETQPDGYQSSGSTAPATTGSEVKGDDELLVKLESEQVAANSNFLNYQPATVSGTILTDPNGDGDTSDGNPRSGVTVQLFTDPNGDGDTSDGTLIGTAITGSDGEYYFGDLVPGDYVLVRKSTDGSGQDEQVDLSLGSGEKTDGELEPVKDGTVSFSGTVKEDSNKDGKLDASDKGLPGVVVTLHTDPNGDGKQDDGKVVVVTTTDSKGEFHFNDVEPGSYVVVETDPFGFVSLADSSGINDNRVPVVLVAGHKPLGISFLDVREEGTPPPVNGDTVQIPTLTEWALIMLSMLMLLVAATRIRQH